jgi:hypothetical protein
MNCPECRQKVPPAWALCPHCGRPALFPNVRAAEEPDQKDALRARYDDAVKAAAGRGSGAEVVAFEAACAASMAVLARPLGEVQRLARSDDEGYATYYQLTEAEVRIPSGDRWDALRRLTDEAIHPGYRAEIRFAALSLDGSGPRNYGDCSVVLRDEMIEHRATVFEENSVLFMMRNAVRIDNIDEAIRGRRATWIDRTRLCVAKLAARLSATTKPADHAGLLLENGATSADDSFVEVHVFGPMTARSFERIQVERSGAKRARGKIRGMREQLKVVGVALEVRT